MASTRQKKQAAEGAGLAAIWALVGLLMFLPFLLISISYFRTLKNKYLHSPTAQRVLDTGQAISFCGGIGALVGLVGVPSLVYGLIMMNEMKRSPAFYALIMFMLCLLVNLLLLGLAIISARHIAMLYLGIIADKENDSLFFPCDMQSYTIGDYIKMQCIKDFYSIDCVKLSEINKMTRGYGKELYVHGAFGSRRIAMSSKQKRDECLAMIQAHAGKKGLIIGETESY